MEGFVFFYIVLVIVLTYYGSKRKIGGLATFLISLLLSPLIGLIVVALSERKESGIINTRYTCENCGYSNTFRFDYCPNCGKKQNEDDDFEQKLEEHWH